MDPNFQIEEDAQLLEVDFRRLAEQEVGQLRLQVLRKYAEPDWDGSYRMCEHLADPCDVMRYLDDIDVPYRNFIGESQAILFFDEMEHRRLKNMAYSFKNGYMVQEIGESCSFFTFYITNPSLDYLIAYSEEQYLFFAGTALPWFEEQKKSLGID